MGGLSSFQFTLKVWSGIGEWEGVRSNAREEPVLVWGQTIELGKKTGWKLNIYGKMESIKQWLVQYKKKW